MTRTTATLSAIASIAEREAQEDDNNEGKPHPKTKIPSPYKEDGILTARETPELQVKTRAMCGSAHLLLLNIQNRQIFDMDPRRAHANT
jgi:hypothetical protein